MVKQRKSRLKIAIVIFVTVVLIIGIFFGVQVRNYLQLIKKENNIVLFKTESNQEIYILGSIHNKHYDKDRKYSIADIQSVIEAIQPDILLVEVRQDTVDTYNALDGPIEMIFAWSYAKENDVEVKGIDWYKITEDMQSNRTNEERDDKIFNNINLSIGDNEKVLIIVGATHLVEQSKRFKDNGFTEVKLNNVEQFFGNVSEANFAYPETMKSEIQKKMEYAQSGMLVEINENIPEGTKAYEYWTTNAQNLVSSLDEILNNLIITNKLYNE